MFIPGVVALWTATLALAASTVFYIRAARGDTTAPAWSRQLYALATFAVAMASVALLYLILAHDFRYHYVFSYSDRSLPLAYLVSSFWAGQEGSFLLWLLAGMLLGLPLMRAARHYEYRTMIVYNLTLIALLAILLRQSPFRLLEGLPPGQVPFDGQGLNPLLQNPWMTIHPPVMFVGYAATAIPFALAIAALVERRYDEWVRAALPWALVSVVTLGAAILLGGYWAYITLGWGGYWGWDPVENSSLVPWLASSALVHGMLLQRARGRFRKLNFSLAILSFVLVIYATFLTRSGVLADFSVHSFVDLGITGWLVANLTVFTLVGLVALLWRVREIPTTPGDEPLLSRTVFAILGIATLLGLAALVLVGTSAPLITRLFTEPAQVGPTFYNRVTLPIATLLAVLLGVVPYLSWRGRSEVFRGRLIVSLVLAAATTGAAVLLGAAGLAYLSFFAASCFALFSNTLKTAEGIAAGRLRQAGGPLAHVGLGLMLAGIVTSSAFDQTEKVVLPLGESRQALAYTLTFKGPEAEPSGRQAMLVEVRRPNGSTYVARPRLFRNEKSNQLVANPHVKVFLARDVYISPIEFDPGREARGAPVELAKGETFTRGPYAITFRGFEMRGSHADTGQVSIGANLAVTYAGATETLAPTLVSTTEGLRAQPVPLPGSTAATVALTGVNASEGRIRLTFENLAASGQAAPAMRLSVDISVKPYINLLWAGLVVLLIGGVLALVRRSNEFATATAETEPR